MTFQPLTNYTGYNHVPVAGAVWFHPKNGNAYCCACEKDPSRRQDLSVYRMRKGASSWELVKRYEGGQASEQQVTMGGAGIEQDGSLLVVTSLIIPGAPYITTEKFQGVWIREPNIDEPWSESIGGSDPRVDALVSQLGAMSQQITQLETALGNVVASEGGITLFPAVVTNPAWEGRTLTGGVLVDIPAVFGVPSAAAYLIRFVASASAPNVRVRAGTEAAPFFCTINTQIAGVQTHTQGWCPGPIAYVSSVNGASLVWLQICGYSG